MKNIILSVAAIVAMSSAGFANEDAPEDKGFYVGLAYSHLSDDIDNEDKTTAVEADFNAVMLEVDYKFNPYISVEGKYNVSLGNTDMDNYLKSAKVSVLSFFVKPMYPIAPEMDIYALLGYSSVDASYSTNLFSLNEGSFAWGAGASYDMTEEFAVFAEYTQFYNDTLNGFNHVIDSFNIGVTYKF